jgi:hypothetical protein
VFAQFVRDMAPGFAESANDEMLLQVGNLFFHPASPEQVTQLAFDQVCGQLREQVDRTSHADKDDKNVEYAKRRIMRGIDDFPVADSGERHHCHIHGVQQPNRRAANQPVADDRNCGDAEQQTKGDDEAFARRHKLTLEIVVPALVVGKLALGVKEQPWSIRSRLKAQPNSKAWQISPRMRNFSYTRGDDPQ